MSYLSLVGLLGPDPAFQGASRYRDLWIERRPFVRAGRPVAKGHVSVESTQPEGKLGIRSSRHGPDCSTFLKAAWSRAQPIFIAESVPYSSALKQLAAGTMDATFAVFDPESGNTPSAAPG